VTKPVIVTKKSSAFKFKKVAPVLSKTNEVKPILKKSKKQVDEEGEVIESTSVTLCWD
jgi:hypothetical protein